MSKLKGTLASHASLEVAMSHVRTALRASKYALVIEQSLRILENSPGYVPALMSLATAVQLAEECDTLGLSLNDAEQALAAAARIQASTDDVAHEYACFLFAVADNPAGAADVLAQASDRRESELRELLSTQLEVLRDLGRGLEVRELLSRASRMFPHSDEFSFGAGSIRAGSGDSDDFGR